MQRTKWKDWIIVSLLIIVGAMIQRSLSPQQQVRPYESVISGEKLDEIIANKPAPLPSCDSIPSDDLMHHCSILSDGRKVDIWAVKSKTK